MKRLMILLGVGLLLAGVSAQQLERKDLQTVPVQSIKIKISVTPATSTGPCPVTVKARASIAVGYVTTVSARFLDSANHSTPAHILTYKSPGSQTIEGTFTYDQTFSGWIVCEVKPPALSPWTKVPVKWAPLKDNLVSDKVNVDIRCQPMRLQRASVECDCQMPNEINLGGIGFGAAQGARQILMDGVPAASYLYWSDTSLSFVGSAILNPDHVYTFVITNNNVPVSNMLSKTFLMCWCDAAPASAKVGAEVELHLFMDAPSQGSYIVKMGTTTMQVLSWSGSPSVNIRVRVPNAAPGPYKITVQKNGTAVTKELGFTVLP